MTETEPVEVPVKGRRRRRLRLVLAVVVVTVAASAVGGVLLLGSPADAETGERDGDVVALEPLTTTLGSAGLNHARIALAVVLAEGEDPAIVAPQAPLLHDALLRHLARMDADGLRSPEGSEGLRARLTEDAQEIWGDDTVRRVLLTELLVQ